MNRDSLLWTRHHFQRKKKEKLLPLLQLSPLWEIMRIWVRSMTTRFVSSESKNLWRRTQSIGHLKDMATTWDVPLGVRPSRLTEDSRRKNIPMESTAFLTFPIPDSLSKIYWRKLRLGRKLEMFRTWCFLVCSRSLYLIPVDHLHRRHSTRNLSNVAQLTWKRSLNRSNIRLAFLIR